MSNFLTGIVAILLLGILAIVIIVAGAIIGAMMSLIFPFIILVFVLWFLWACYQEHKNPPDKD